MIKNIVTKSTILLILIFILLFPNCIKETFTNSRQSSRPFISVDYWLELSDTILDSPGKKLGKNAKIIFLKTDLISNYIEQLENHNTDFILISASNIDYCVPYLSYPGNNNLVSRILNCKNLLRWFCKNPCIVNPKIEPIPIGPKWQWHSTEFYGESKTKHLHIFKKYCMNPKKLFYSNKSKLLYINFTPSSTSNPFYKPHVNNRENALKDLSRNFDTTNNKLDFENYIIQLSKYKFCISPPGNGIDCHRTWEALMVGTIPIVVASPLDKLFDNLPVIIVRDYKSISKKYLDEKYYELRRKKYNFSKLYTNYWKKYII